MSHFTTIKTEFKDGEAIVEALEQLGLQPLSYDSPQVLNGYGGQQRQAHIVVRKTCGYADLGFLKEGDLYSLVADDMDLACGSYGRTAYGHTFFNDLKKECALSQAVRAVQRLGYRANVQPTASGGYRIRATQLRVRGRR